MRFYHSGAETDRIGKVEFIADNPVVQKGLTVCGEPVSCGRCFKCLRTMAELYALDKLDKFGAVFDVENYYKHQSSMLARELAADHAPFTTEIMECMRRRDKKIPPSVWLKKDLCFRWYYYFKKKMRNNRFFMKLYYEKGWKERLGEGKVDPDVAKARMEGYTK